jgi:uroporphyrinogen decarboxylase
MRDLFLRALAGERTERPPVWLMRQAGRYLPEYREVRSDYTFLEAIKTPEVAERISLQPYERFQPDAVVMYSDILTVLEPLGFDYRIESGVGPVVDDPVDGPGDVDRPVGDVREGIDYVGDLVERLQDTLAGDAAVLGFAGGPFTLASYAVEGGPTRTHMSLRALRAAHPDAFGTLLDRFTEVTVEYLQFQEDRGADAVQVFDTYAGVLSPADYEAFLLPLHRRIHDAVDLPSIQFARDMGGNLELLAASGADAVGLDWTVDMARARDELGGMPVQGNLDPSSLMGDPEFVRERTREVIRKAGPEGHVLNLGHGVHEETPVDCVEAFVETAKAVER